MHDVSFNPAGALPELDRVHLSEIEEENVGDVVIEVTAEPHAHVFIPSSCRLPSSPNKQTFMSSAEAGKDPAVGRTDRLLYG